MLLDPLPHSILFAENASISEFEIEVVPVSAHTPVMLIGGALKMIISTGPSDLVLPGTYCRSLDLRQTR